MKQRDSRFRPGSGLDVWRHAGPDWRGHNRKIREHPLV